MECKKPTCWHKETNAKKDPPRYCSDTRGDHLPFKMQKGLFAAFLLLFLLLLFHIGHLFHQVGYLFNQ
jgi:hypothetical protein